MAKIDLQYDLVNYTPASASPVEANFNRIEQHINQEVIERGGTVAMTAQLRLVGDPVNDLDAAPKQYVDQVLPLGIVMMFGGTTVPPGGRWAFCNGAELQTATYPALFAIIGNNFSPGGTPAGRFHLPNLLDRFPMGNGGLAAIGATGGTKDAVLPAHAHGGGFHTHGLEQHTHPVNIGTGTVSVDHSHNASIENAAHNHFANWGEVFHSTGNPTDNVNVFSVRVGDGITIQMEKFNTNGQWATGDENQNHSHNMSGITANHTHGVNGNTGSAGGWGGPQGASITTDTQGASPTNANLPPYLGMAYIMRVL
jgi:microcystin-dependent protein